MDKIAVVILAGGDGTRLWPVSREAVPKQFLSFERERSLLQMTIDRIIDAPFVESILIVTSGQHCPLVQLQIENSEKISILVEPEGRNTAAAISLAVKYLEEKTSPSWILVLPSDHIIEPKERFWNCLQHPKAGFITTFGIKPTRVETGYGYIQTGDLLQEGLFALEGFVEKPGFVAAREMFEDGGFYWNSGMFLFESAVFLEELAKYAPEIYQYCHSYEMLLSNYGRLPKISIDYALMEKTLRIAMRSMEDIFWSDIGSWDSFYEALSKDGNGNVKMGNVIEIETKDCLIIGRKRLISTCGVEDLVIIETEDAIYVGRRGESQRVKEILKLLLSRQEKCPLL